MASARQVRRFENTGCVFNSAIPMGSGGAIEGAGNNIGGIPYKHRMQCVSEVLTHFQPQTNAAITPNIWAQLLQLLLIQLKLKRQRTSVEATISQRNLSILLRTLPKAMPESQKLMAMICTPDVQAALLAQQHVGKLVDERVLSKIDLKNKDMNLTDIFNTLFVMIMELAMACKATQSALSEGPAIAGWLRANAPVKRF